METNQRFALLEANPELLSNPAWVTKTLADYFEVMEEKIPPALLPKLDDVRAIRGSVAGKLHEYGCGAYGCVLPTLTPEIVLKVTTDETEAEFAAKLSHTLVVPVVVNYRLVLSLPVKHQHRRVYLLWRESAEDVGGLKSKADRLVDDQHQRANEVYKLIAEGERGDELRDALQHWQEALETMAAAPELAYVADGMLRIFREQGIGVFDVHAGNLGLVERDGKKRWVVVDPGHVSVFQRPRTS